MRKTFLPLTLLLLAITLFGDGASAATSPLVWNEKEKTFNADVSGVPLPELLKTISTATGWEVYLEPGTSYSASAKFRDIPHTDALRRLLGKLNFEISTQTNSVPKLFVFHTGAGKATQLIRGDAKKIILGKDRVILNHLIVSLKRGSKTDINVLAQQLGAKVIGKLEGVDSYLLEFPDEASTIAAREQLSRVDEIASVDSNYSMERPTPFSMASSDRGSSFNLKADATGGDGKQTIIGMIDTAVQKLGANMDGFLLPAIAVAGEANPGGDVPTHGTAMAESILAGLNSTATQGQPSSVRILPVDIYGNNTDTTTFYVADGIVRAVNGGANILSLSLGSAGDSPFLGSLIEQVSEKGIPIFAAAGNQPVTSPTYPAAYPQVIAVTSAADRNGTLAPYANRGSFVDVILPGANIVPFNGRSYYVNGTSVSTALASGMMAGLAESTRQAPMKILPTFRNSIAYKPQ